MKNNIQKAKHILEKLYASGVRDFVVCPGGRNAPFVELLDKCSDENIKVHWGFEERSAAFFALGLSMKAETPVAVFTTSGTAFVETSSALLEAHYTGLPLIVVSSDRPEKQWGTGAPQTLIQKDFLISHLGPSVDEHYDILSVSYPLHINCTFEEPLIDKVIESWTFSHILSDMPRTEYLNPYKFSFSKYSYSEFQLFLDTHKILEISKTRAVKTLLVVSSLPSRFKKQLNEMMLSNDPLSLKSFNLDIYCEAMGELASCPTTLDSRDIDQKNVMDEYDFIIRLGGIPTHRFWRDLELKSYEKVLHFSQLPLPGLSVGNVYNIDSFIPFLKDLKALSSETFSMMTSIEKSSETSVQFSIDEKKLFSVLKKIGARADKSKGADYSVFYVGNSLPIRHWDLDKTVKFNTVHASRGLNGIDGQLSTAIGLALKSPQQKVVTILGDLTTMYDLTAPWYWKKNKAELNMSLFVINNSGGQIFSKMFKSPNFLNSHSLNFKSWAEMWGLSYASVKSSEEVMELYSSFDQWPDIIEYHSEL